MEDQSKIAFGIIIAFALFLAFWIKAVILSGMFMGIVSTIAIWVLVMKFPKFLKTFMARHILISDLILTGLATSVIAAIGPGPTIFMAMMTQMVLVSLLLHTLPKN